MIFVIVGPTGVGKSSLSIEFAKSCGGVIVNGDAFQCYKQMSIGTAKPSLQERQSVPHYLFDIADVRNAYTIYEYQHDLRQTLDELIKLNKHIIIVGGSGLYLKSALYDFTLNDVVNPVDMSKYEKMDEDTLYDCLQKIDYKASLTIHKHNRKRVLRAIQIFLESGKKKTDIIASQEHKPLYDVIFVGLSKPSREELYNMINNRVDIMVKDGLIDEVKMLMKEYDSSLRAFQAIGYKELMDAIINNTSIESALELIKKRTRNYAKRQYTYFKNQLNVNWFVDKNEALDFMQKKVRGM